jgi:hypothetical protein
MWSILFVTFFLVALFIHDLELSNFQHSGWNDTAYGKTVLHPHVIGRVSPWYLHLDALTTRFRDAVVTPYKRALIPIRTRLVLPIAVM